MDTKALAEYLLKRLGLSNPNQQNVPQRQGVLRPLRCGMCGGDHSTYQCPGYPTQNNPPPPRISKWCAHCNRYSNHETAECYYRPRNQNPNFQRQGAQYQQPPPPRYQTGQPQALPAPEKIQPVLGQQPPMPGNQQAVVRYVQQAEENEMAIVPTMPYYEEDSKSKEYSRET